jgi:hypothetical protein
MVIYMAGHDTTAGAAVIVPFPSLAKCEEAKVYVLKQSSVSAAFCIDTSRLTHGGKP